MKKKKKKKKKKKTMYTLYGGRSPPYDNMHIGLGNEKKNQLSILII